MSSCAVGVVRSREDGLHLLAKHESQGATVPECWSLAIPVVQNGVQTSRFRVGCSGVFMTTFES